MSTEKRPGVAAAIYEDVISPAAREVGGALEKLVRLGLLPVNFAVDGFTEAAEAALQNARERLARKRVPKERIVTPPPEVTVPVVNSLRIRGGDEGIRDMYLNLLAGAMDSSTQRLAHPAFADIIRQLTPFEAKVIPLFDPPFQSHSPSGVTPVRLARRSAASRSR